MLSLFFKDQKVDNVSPVQRADAKENEKRFSGTVM